MNRRRVLALVALVVVLVILGILWCREPAPTVTPSATRSERPRPSRSVRTPSVIHHEEITSADDTDDVVEVCEGTYAEPVTIDMLLIGAGSAGPEHHRIPLEVDVLDDRLIVRTGELEVAFADVEHPGHEAINAWAPDSTAWKASYEARVGHGAIQVLEGTVCPSPKMLEPAAVFGTVSGIQDSPPSLLVCDLLVPISSDGSYYAELEPGRRCLVGAVDGDRRSSKGHFVELDPGEERQINLRLEADSLRRLSQPWRR